MRHRIVNVLLVLSVLLARLTLAGAAPSVRRGRVAATVQLSQDPGSSLAVSRLKPIAIGAMRSNGVHLVPPSRSVLDAELRQVGVPMDASAREIQEAQKRLRRRFARHSQTWVNPEMQQWVLDREAALASPSVPGSQSAAAIQPVTATVYAMAVQFGATETFTLPVEQPLGYCMTETVEIAGPLAGQMERPGPRDNFALWYEPDQTRDAKFYEQIIFGYQGAGRVRDDLTDPDDGLPGINLAGYTVQDYYDGVAGEGNVTITGTVDGWVTVPHSVGYYGADNCRTGSHGGGNGLPVSQLVIDAIDVLSGSNPSLWNDPEYWPTYDANDDGILDTFWVIHAGAGQEGGGGAEGSFAIWSHSSDLRHHGLERGYQVYEGDPTTDEDDIYVGPYTMQPENADTGVLAEEFGHNFFGLPDLYTSDASNSIGNWSIMSGGAWLGWLGGTAPASMPLWFKTIAAVEHEGGYLPLNWHLPMVTRAYDDVAAEVVIGQLEKTPAGVNKGVRVNLPEVEEEIANLAGEGKGAYSGSGRDGVTLALSADAEIPVGSSSILSVNAHWAIEQDWDYAYLAVDGVTVADMDGYTTDDDPNGNNLGHGLTGYGEGTLRFDLSAYAGQTVELAFLYRTDAAVTEAGIWIDDLSIGETLLDDFEGASGPGTFDRWSNTDPGWLVVPYTATYYQYYLVEWRTSTKYDRMIARTSYIHTEVTETEEIVERIPYNLPAALVYLRNTKYGSTYAMAPNRADPPSAGSKYQLLVVDMNWTPLRIGDTPETHLGYWTGRLSSYDSGLSLQDAPPFTISGYWGLPGAGPWHYASRPAVRGFNDTLGYYGGFYFGPPCPPSAVCYAERDGSAVLPARDLYSAQIATFDFAPIYGLYGYPWPPSWLGSGNPGDDNVQYGVNVDLISTGGEDAYHSTATLRFRSYSVDFLTMAVPSVVGTTYRVTYRTEIVNLGQETAEGMLYEIFFDDDLSFVSIDVANPSGVPGNAVESSAGVQVTVGDLAAGERATVTAVGEMPLVPGIIELESAIVGFDGQVERGPYYVASTDAGHVLYFPLAIVQ